MDPVQVDSGGRITVTGHSHGISHFSGDLTSWAAVAASQWWVDNATVDDEVICMFHFRRFQCMLDGVAPWLPH